MENHFLRFVVTIVFVSFFGFEINAQTIDQSDTIFITDIRDQGIATYDTSTLGREVNEVYITRCLKDKTFNLSTPYYRTEAYQVHFFKLFEGKLRNYQMSLVSNADFDKAAYVWMDDITVSVTLFNSISGFRKNIKLVQTFSRGSSAGVLTESLNPRY